MTRIEKLAAEYAGATNDWAADREGMAFAAGARWALEQMTSEAAVKAAIHSHDDLPFEDQSDEQLALRLLSAVRKEIEG